MTSTDAVDSEKAKRREWGSGGVYYDATRNRWVGTIEAGITARGTRRRIKVHGKTDAACRAAMRKKRDEIARDGMPTEGASDRVTVRAFAGPWLERTARKLRPNAQIANAAAVNKWIIPTIGKKRLKLLTPADVRAVEMAIIKDGKSSSTAQRYQGTLMKMLRDAQLEGYAVPPRLLLMEAPRRAASDRDAIQPQDAYDLLAALGPDGSRWVAALLQGMRQGECLGLTWACVDLDQGVTDVSWQLQEVPFRHGCGTKPCAFKRPGSCPSRKLSGPDGYEIRQLDGRICLVRPKTSAGRRVIPLVPWMTAALTAWRELCPPSPHDLVWPAEDGRPRDEKADRAAWYRLQDKAQVAHTDGTTGRRYLLHEARHTTATLLLQAGIDPKVIEAMMGHTKIATTRGYQHVNVELARKAMEAVAESLQLGPAR